MIEKSTHKFIGKDEMSGCNMYLVPIRENREKRKEINLDDGLFDGYEFTKDYYDECNLELPQPPERDTNNLTLSDFQEMEFKEIYFLIYQQLKSISHLLSDAIEVGEDERKL